MPRILIVDDKRSMVQMLKYALKAEGYDTIHAYTLEEALSKVGSTVDAVVVDLRLPDGDGIELLRVVKERHPFTPVVVITAYGTIEKAVASIKEGAYDFLQKPFDVEQLLNILRRALKERDLRQENLSIKAQFRSQFEEPILVGKSEAWLKVLESIELVASLKTTVLIKGESGTGKELVARAIHFKSQRARYPFITINCPAVPKDLLESEFFGHEKGAFTGATETKPGKFELANRGTVFLDEIGDLEINLQAKLLRVLEYGEFERVGGIKPIKVDVRVIAATNKDLEAEIEKGRFREDLFFRLNVFPIRIPPLRERKEDILPLAEYFIGVYAKELKRQVPILSEEMKAFLLSSDWRGNVRELKNTIERAMILSKSNVLLPENKIKEKDDELHSENMSLKELTKAGIERVERQRIINALKETKGNKLRASKLLRVSYKTLLTKIKLYGIGEED